MNRLGIDVNCNAQRLHMFKQRSHVFNTSGRSKVYLVYHTVSVLNLYTKFVFIVALTFLFLSVDSPFQHPDCVAIGAPDNFFSFAGKPPRNIGKRK